jgi:plasmid stabilization system protein ParE
MNVRFTSTAYRELSEATEYYDGKQPGLAYCFLSEVKATVERIERSPEMWAKASSRLRRCLVHRFPYAVFYHVDAEEIQIVAVADLRRDPGRWEHLL